MAVQKMQKVALLVSQKEVQPVLAFLQESGSFELIETTSDVRAEAPAALKGVEGKLANTAFAIRFLLPNAPEKTNLREKLLGDRVESTEEQALLAMEKDFTNVIDTCVDLEEKKNTITARISRIEDLKKALSAWKDFSLSLGFDRSTENVEVRLGSIETKEYLDFSTKMEEIAGTHIHVVSKGEKDTYFLFLFAKKDTEEVHVQLDTFRFTESDFSDMTGTPGEEMAKLNTEKQELLAQDAEVEAKRTELAVAHLAEMKLAHDGLTWKKEKKNAIESSSATKTTVSFEGWIPGKKFDTLKNGIANITPAFEMTVVETAEGEHPPVELSNGIVTRPFEMVTKFFALPEGKEMDPTPFVAPFFALFFGFCLTDAGYGLLITLAAVWALKVVPMTRPTVSAMWLLLLCGVSTIIWGIVFGGYFGITPENLPFLMNPETGKFYGQLVDPIKDLSTVVMPLAYALGFIQLFLSTILKGVVFARLKETTNILMITVPSLALLTSGLLLILGALVPAFSGLPTDILKYILFVSPVILLFGLGSGGVIARPLIGLLGLFNLALGWLSNILSYSRLFALGLATGIVASSFNTIGGILGESLPIYIAIPAMILVLAFGHTLNFAMNLLGAGIHTARLQFVEFFGGFFSGGGRAFSPLKRSRQYLFDGR